MTHTFQTTTYGVCLPIQSETLKCVIPLFVRQETFWLSHLFCGVGVFPDGECLRTGSVAVNEDFPTTRQFY